MSLSYYYHKSKSITNPSKCLKVLIYLLKTLLTNNNKPKLDAESVMTHQSPYFPFVIVLEVSDMSMVVALGNGLLQKSLTRISLKCLVVKFAIKNMQQT